MKKENKKVDEDIEIKKSKKNNIKYLIIGLVSIIIILAVTLGIVLVKNKKEDNANNTIDENKTKINTSNLIKGSSYEELIKNVEEDEKNVVSKLENKFEILKKDTDTYEKYIANKEKVKEFYDKIVIETDNFGIRVRKYCLKYVELIMKEDIPTEDKYDKLDDVYDEFYENIGDDIYNDIYDGIYDELYNYYYDGIFDDAYDTVSYTELSNNRSNEYKWCSDSRSDAYKSISDMRSDIYKLRSNMGTKLYQGKEDKALEEIEDFRQDIEKIEKKNQDVQKKEQENKQNKTQTDVSKKEEKITETSNDELRIEFKNAMDSYEKYIDEYIAFMKKYNDNPSDIELLNEYGSVMTKYQTAMNDFQKWNSNNLNKKEQKYYVEVQTRVSKKLADIAIDMQ